MSDSIPASRIADVHARTKELYDKKQWAVWAIGGDDTSPPFSYTSGAILKGRPDVFLQGLVGLQAQHIINAVIDAMPENVDDAYFGKDVHALPGFQIAGSPMRYKLVPMSAERAREVKMMAVFHHELLPETQTRFYELLLADGSNKLPGEEGYVEWRKYLS